MVNSDLGVPNLVMVEKSLILVKILQKLHDSIM